MDRAFTWASSPVSSIGCVQNVCCKLCSYLAPTQTLSPNEKKRDSTWPTSPRGSIGCVQNYFRALVCSTQTMHLSCIKISTISKWNELSLEPSHLGVPSGVSISRKLWTYLAPTLTLSTNGKKRDSTWPTSLSLDRPSFHLSLVT
jgi:hypothetical protein